MNWFKNLKIRMKMIVSFGLIIAIMVGVSLYAVIKLKNVDETYDYVIAYPVEEELLMVEFRGEVYEFQSLVNAIVMYAPAGDTAMIDALYKDAAEMYGEAIHILDTFEDSVENDPKLNQSNETTEVREIVDIRRDLAQYKDEVFEPVTAAARAGDYDGALELIAKGTPIISKLSDDIYEVYDSASASAEAEADAIRKSADESVLLIILISVIAVLVAVFLALYVSKLIGEVRYMSMALNQLGTTGNLVFDAEVMKSAERCSSWKDEIGDCARSFGATVQHLTEIEGELNRIAAGDLTVDVNVASDRDNIGLSVAKMVESLNSMFSEINASSAQVTIGAGQVATGSQTLAQGSTEQASSVEELSASISEISDKTKQNTGMTGKAAALSDSIKVSAEKGNQQMDQLMHAVMEINDANQSISKVIKAIDDIAFQTNILALNAAVEAARAGQHGKGFAVVADEVRSLAAKSADSAKETGALIQNSISKANMGLNTANETLSSLKEIIEGINKNADIVAQIAKSTNDQAVAILQINEGIDQVSQVIQQNSATAEESAAASEEMSGQASLLQELVTRFKLKNASTGHSYELIEFAEQEPAAVLLGGGDSGKY